VKQAVGGTGDEIIAFLWVSLLLMEGQLLCLQAFAEIRAPSAAVGHLGVFHANVA
jgi:hypothetical protein